MGRRQGSRTRLSPDQRKAAIVGAAVRVFEGRDPASVTFEEIAAEAGVSRALVYNYFGDRGGLMAAVYEQLLTGLDEEIAQALQDPRPPRERMHDAVERYVSFARTHARGWQTQAMLAATRHPEVQRARRQRYARLATVWGDSPEAHVAITGLMGLLEAVTLDWLADPAVDVTRLVELADDLVWSGVAHLVDEGVVASGGSAAVDQPLPAAPPAGAALAGASSAPAMPSAAMTSATLTSRSSGAPSARSAPPTSAAPAPPARTAAASGATTTTIAATGGGAVGGTAPPAPGGTATSSTVGGS